MVFDRIPRESEVVFREYGIESGVDLVNGIYFDLAERGHRQFVPTQAFFDELLSATRAVFAAESDATGMPPSVAAAVSDAVDAVAHEYVDRPDAFLRTEVLPDLYERMVRFYRAYSGTRPVDGAGTC